MANHCSTVSIVSLIDKLNAFCLNTADDMKAERETMAIFVADILHQNNVYSGFNYLYASDMEKSQNGTSVGIIFDESEARNHVYPDQSRVHYHVSRKLQPKDRILEKRKMPSGMHTIRLTNGQADTFLAPHLKRKLMEWLDARSCSMVYVNEYKNTLGPVSYGTSGESGYVIGAANANTLMEFKLAWL